MRTERNQRRIKFVTGCAASNRPAPRTPPSRTRRTAGVALADDVSPPTPATANTAADTAIHLRPNMATSWWLARTPAQQAYHENADTDDLQVGWTLNRGHGFHSTKVDLACCRIGRSPDSAGRSAAASGSRSTSSHTQLQLSKDDHSKKSVAHRFSLNTLRTIFVLRQTL